MTNPPPIIGLESIVCSLEMAKKLKEAGYPQDVTYPFFVWVEDKHGTFVGPMTPGDTLPSRGMMEPTFIAYAPTAEEVLRRLPRNIPWKNDSDNTSSLFVNIFPSTYRVGYSPQWTQDVWSTPDAETLADAAAAAYIYLADAGLLPSQ